MAASFITATIIEHNNTKYLDQDLVVYGSVQLIPTPGAGGRPDGDYWADPITDLGVVDSFNFIPVETGVAAPSAQAFKVFRLITSKAFGKADYWYVLGTQAEYLLSAAAAECCDEAVPMPDEVPPIAPSQDMCQYNNSTDQKYFAVFGVPSLGFGDRLYAYGWFNGVELPELSGAGYLTAALLATAMTSAWGVTVGGTFTESSDGLTITLTQTAGDGEDVIAVNVFASVVSS